MRACVCILRGYRFKVSENCVRYVEDLQMTMEEISEVCNLKLKLLFLQKDRYLEKESYV